MFTLNVFSYDVKYFIYVTFFDKIFNDLEIYFYHPIRIIAEAQEDCYINTYSSHDWLNS